MQYNKQLFTCGHWSINCISAHLAKKLAYTSSFLPLERLSFSGISLAVTKLSLENKRNSQKITPKTIYLPQRVPYLGIQFSLLPIEDLSLCTELNNDLIATSLREFPGRSLQLPALLCETSLLRDRPYRARMWTHGTSD